jgi:hypothetical protein
MRGEEFLPQYDMVERHETHVEADVWTTYRAIRETDLARSLPVRILFGVRMLPHLLTGRPRLSTRVGLNEMLRYGFVVLADDEPRDLVVGIVGRFWRPLGGVERVRAEDFTSFDRPGYAKGVMTLHVEPEGAGSRVVTETRVRCLDPQARRAFSLYWTAVGPFSGYIRRAFLEAIRKQAEA